MALRQPIGSGAALAALAAGMLAATPVLAQVDELVVTATKREASLQDVPIAVSAFDNTQLRNASVDDIKEIMSLSASFQSTSNVNETQATVIRLRGIGTESSNPGFESAVGVFIDGVYRARPGIALSEFLDVERVEVLRGPQGTLFGRNTSAGALNIVTAGPEMDFGGYAEATYGNFDQMDFRGSITGPIVQDILAVRFSAVYNERDEGFVEDLLSGEELNTKERYFLKGQVLFTPTDDIDLRIIGDYRETDDNCCFPVTLGLGLASGSPVVGQGPKIINGTVPASTVPVGILGPFAGTGPMLPLGIQLTGGAYNRIGTKTLGLGNEQEVEDWGISAELNWDLGFATFTSVTGYRDFESFNSKDIDFTTADLLFNARVDQNEIFTQELRLQGEWERVDWLIGAYYSNEKIRIDNATVYGSDYESYMDARLGSLYGTLLSLPPLRAAEFIGALTGFAVNTDTFNGGAGGWAAGTGSFDEIEQDGEAFSIFTHNVFNLTDALRLTIGARYNVDEKDASSSYLQNDAGCQAFRTALANHPLIGDGAVGFNALMRDLVGVNSTIFPTDDRRVRDVAAALPCLQLTSSSFDLQHRSAGDKINKDDDEWSGTVVLDYDITEDVLGYVSYSRGFKAGGINLDRSGSVLTEPGNVSQSSVDGTRFDRFNFFDPRFDAEVVDAYEIGFKTSFFNNRLNVNVAGFLQKVDDFQLNTFTGFSFQPENVEDVESKGIEIEIAANPAEGLDLTLGFTYTDAEYGSSITDRSNREINDVFLETGNEAGVPDRATNCFFLPFALPGASCGDLLLDESSPLAGRTLTNASEYVIVGGITYERPLFNSDFLGFVHVDGRYDSGYNTGSDLDPIKEQGGYAVFNGRLGVSGYDGLFELEVWGRNLLDKQYKSIAFDIPLQAENGFGVFLAEPRTYGVTLRSNF